MSRRTFLRSAGKALTSTALLSYISHSAVAHQTVIDTAPHHLIDRLHQIIIAEGYGMPSGFPDAAAARIKRFKQLYPSADYTLWTGERLREFIAYHLGTDVVWAFDTLKPLAYKSDLARYCLLQEIGGLYSDLDILHDAPWRIPSMYPIAAFKTFCIENPDRFDVDNGVMWAQRGSNVLERAINRIVAHCKGRFLGTRSTDPSGSGLLGWAWASTHVEQWQEGKADGLYLGVARSTQVSLDIETHFVPAGIERVVVGHRTKRRLDEASFGADSDAHEAQSMYRVKDVYR